jgi:hypothetical protein
VVVGAGDEVATGGVDASGSADVRARWRWLAPLFPVASPSKEALAVRAVGYLFGFCSVLVLALMRQPGVPATETIWAEDGVTFYAQSLSKPFARSLVTAYNGYDQLLPRSVARVARATPVADIALVVALLGAGGLAAIGCRVFHLARGPYLGHPCGRCSCSPCCYCPSPITNSWTILSTSRGGCSSPLSGLCCGGPGRRPAPP